MIADQAHAPLSPNELAKFRNRELPCTDYWVSRLLATLDDRLTIPEVVLVADGCRAAPSMTDAERDQLIAFVKAARR